MKRGRTPPGAGAAIVAALALVFAGAGALRAQRLATGLKGGLNSSIVVGADVANASAAQAFSGGAFVTVRVRRTVAVRAEALFSRKAAAWSLTEPRNVVRLDYIEVPLLAKLSLPLSGAVAEPHLLAGAEIAFRVRCRVDAPAQGIPFATPCDNVDGATFTHRDHAAIAGGGFDFRLGTTRVTLDARYVLGLTNIVQDAAHDRVRTRTFAAMLGLELPVLP